MLCRTNLIGDLLNLDSSLPTENEKNIYILDILLYGNSKFNTITDQNILIYTLTTCFFYLNSSVTIFFCFMDYICRCTNFLL